MELYHLDNHIDETLAAKADLLYTPIGGTFELLPLCNMDCKMCYMKHTKEEMKQQGRMLSCDEWIAIAEQAQKNGVLFLLLTGGEPLLYPEFERLYKKLLSMGFVISLNTNGTLINEYWADLFAKYPCRRINITLYGKDDETYGKLCNNPKGFSQVMKAAELLNQRNIAYRFTCSITPYNKEQISELYAIAHRCNVTLTVCSYMFPPTRRADDSSNFIRLSPKESAETFVQSYVERFTDEKLCEVSKNTLNKIGNQTDYSWAEGLTCRAGRSGFWINWKGEMLPCAMFNEPKMKILNYSFEEAWEYIKAETKKIQRCMECEECEKRDICKTCTAACLAETGKSDGTPKYLCEMTDELIKLCKEITEIE